MRAKPLLSLLNSVLIQSVYPDEIIIVDGSINEVTQEILEKNQFQNLNYYKVDSSNRGLTKQRNFGIDKVNSEIDIVCFLDDDIVLETDYFEKLMSTYTLFPDALGVGGAIINESKWEFVGENYKPKITEFYYDGWKKKDGSRFVIRKKVGLDSDKLPGFMPNFSHGRSLGFIPPTDKIYKVEQLMGGVSSFKKSVFSTFKFSTYFEGYGLYEDADFTLRVSKTGALYLNTKAKLSHYHDSSGRPNQYLYGKMVVRNGWYVWRVKYPNPTLKARLKWNATSFLLTLIRFSNTFTTANKKEAFTESMGRIVGWFSLLFNKPKIQY
jgi:glycosyltransferase involved in cell wall biosynthesis